MVSEVARWLFDPSGLTPHGFCLLWEPWLIWTHALSNIAIGLAYFSIPVVLLRFMRRRQDLVFKPVFGLFAAFILLCGAGHWADLLTLWYPLYGVEATIKAGTAAVSLLTAGALWPLLPKALAIPSPAQLQAANAALRESEERHRGSFVGAPVALHLLNADGRIVEVSGRWLDLLGYAREQVIGRHISEFLDADSSAEHRKRFPAFVQKDGVELWDMPRRFFRGDGAPLDVLVSARGERTGDGRVHVVASLVDVTGRLRAEEALRASEEALRQAQKMEAIGQLTGGVAHDFNNVLQVVTGNLELIRKRVRDDHLDVARLAGNALDASAKAAKLTSQLLSFARRQRLDAKPLDPAEVVDAMRELLARTVGERIALRVEAGAGAGPCLADRNQLESALLNLVINARDAIGSAAGTIAVSIRRERVAAPPPSGWPPEGDYVRIAVRDNGPGMPEEVRRRAFEPFFTTKGQGKGTGLGLAQIHGFAHQSGCTASIESAPGEGTEVAILLPRAGEQAQASPESAAPSAEPEAGSGETVLVVDDDPLVRGAVAETLRDLGYRVLEAGDADAAFHALEGAAVDAVLSDVMMPGSMDGAAFAQAVRVRSPGLPMILATGHVGGLIGKPLPPGVALLKKPLSRSAIARALRRALAGAPRAVDA